MPVAAKTRAAKTRKTYRFTVDILYEGRVRKPLQKRIQEWLTNTILTGRRLPPSLIAYSKKDGGNVPHFEQNEIKIRVQSRHKTR